TPRLHDPWQVHRALAAAADRSGKARPAGPRARVSRGTHAVILSNADVERHLRRVAEWTSDAPTVDVHAHATELIPTRERRARDPDAGAVENQPSRPPVVTQLRLAERLGDSDAFAEATKNQLSTALFQRAYDHVSPSVFDAHMQLAHIGSVLLLPVAAPAGGIGEQMAELHRYRAAGARFHIGYCVPAHVPNSEIASDLRHAVDEHGACAVKLHPNLRDLDLTRGDGRTRVEAIVAACGEIGLPLVVHGGRSPILGDTPAAGRAVLANLETIDWSVSNAPVVIAHLGVYGVPGDAVEDGGRRLDGLLARHDNLMTDTSGVDHAGLAALLPRIHHQRIMFRSDALER